MKVGYDSCIYDSLYLKVASNSYYSKMDIDHIRGFSKVINDNILDFYKVDEVFNNKMVLVVVDRMIKNRIIYSYFSSRYSVYF